MFGNKRKNSKTEPLTRNDDITVLSNQREHPKVILIDLPDGVASSLKEGGHNITVGTLGPQYRVPKSDNRLPVQARPSLPYLTEQEIVVLDMANVETVDYPIQVKDIIRGERYFWVKTASGIIDPRPRVVWAVRDEIRQILEHGGILVVFGDYQPEIEYSLGELGYRGLDIEYSIKLDIWSILPDYEKCYLGIQADRGIQINIDNDNVIGRRVLLEFIQGAEFTCTFEPSHKMADRWLSLAKNKYGRDVAGLYVIENESSTNGYVFIFPNINDKAGLLSSLLDSCFPTVAPKLFPKHEKADWVHKDPYEHLSVKSIDRRIEDIKRNAEAAIQELVAAREAERAALEYRHQLLTGTGKDLVLAVKKVLEEVGFRSVIDVDENKPEGEGTSLDEDLQIADQSPLILVEVKGITWTPKDEDALAVQKYIAPRMKKTGRTDIVGLSIINHEKHLPPLERDKTVFRDVVLASAEHGDVGLMTTWDLYRLLLNLDANHWALENIKPLFYQRGRIQPIPSNYKSLGLVEKVYEKAGAVSIELKWSDISVGDKIAFDLESLYFEQRVDEIMLDGADSVSGAAGQFVGIPTSLTRRDLKPGTRVFKVV